MVAALAAKCTGAGDRQYLPDAGPDFDVVDAIRPQSAIMWRLADYEPRSAGGPGEYSVRGKAGV